MNGFSNCRHCRIVALASRRRNLTSPISGIAETLWMLYFCGQPNITAGVKAIPIWNFNEATDRMVRSDAKYRFSIAMASLKSE